MWRTEPPPPPLYGWRCRFPVKSGMLTSAHFLLWRWIILNSVNCGVCVRLYLQLLHRRHVVAEHAIFQHGNGVTLTAHFLNLITSAVAAGSYTRVRLNVTYVSEELIPHVCSFTETAHWSLEERSRSNYSPDTRVTHAVSMVTISLQLHDDGALKAKTVSWQLAFRKAQNEVKSEWKT